MLFFYNTVFEAGQGIPHEEVMREFRGEISYIVYFVPFLSVWHNFRNTLENIEFLL